MHLNNPCLCEEPKATKQSFLRDCFASLAMTLSIFISPLLAWADPGVFRLSSTAFEDNASIPKDYTCDGRNINPPLELKNIPEDTKSVALTVSDPDAPSGRWSHWVTYDISPDSVDILENSSPGTKGVNDFGKYGYGGPCPPGGKLHHYIFRAYALDADLKIKEGASISDIEKIVEGHIIAQSKLVGTYEKS